MRRLLATILILASDDISVDDDVSRRHLDRGGLRFEVGPDLSHLLFRAACQSLPTFFALKCATPMEAMKQGLHNDLGSGSASRTAPSLVDCNSLDAGLSVPVAKSCRQVRFDTGEGFVWCSAAELGSRYDGVVVREVLGDKALKYFKGIEGVQIQPSMPELGPQGLDKRVRLNDVDLGNDVVRVCEAVEAEVFGAAVGHDVGRRRFCAADGQRIVNEDMRGLRGQLGLQGPSQDFPRVVIEDGVQIGPRSIDKPDDRDVDMEPLARTFGPKSELGSCGIQSSSRPSPLVPADYSAPRLVGGEQTPSALGKQDEGTDRQMLERIGFDHVAHRGALLDGEPCGNRPRTGRRIIELASVVRQPPLSKSRRPKAEDAKGRAMPDVWRGAGDGPENAALRRSHRNSLLRQGGLRRSNERKKKAYDGRQDLDSSLQLGQLNARVDVIRFSRDDIGQASAEPRASRRSRNIETREYRHVARCDDRSTDAVIIGPATCASHDASRVYAELDALGDDR